MRSSRATVEILYSPNPGGRALATWLKLFRAARAKYLSKKEWNQLKVHVPKLAH